MRKWLARLQQCSNLNADCRRFGDGVPPARHYSLRSSGASMRVRGKRFIVVASRSHRQSVLDRHRQIRVQIWSDGNGLLRSIIEMRSLGTLIKVMLTKARIPNGTSAHNHCTVPVGPENLAAGLPVARRCLTIEWIMIANTTTKRALRTIIKLSCILN